MTLVHPVVHMPNRSFSVDAGQFLGEDSPEGMIRATQNAIDRRRPLLCGDARAWNGAVRWHIFNPAQVIHVSCAPFD